jgi:hypothetical protein
LFCVGGRKVAANTRAAHIEPGRSHGLIRGRSLPHDASLANPPPAEGGGVRHRGRQGLRRQTLWRASALQASFLGTGALVIICVVSTSPRSRKPSPPGQVYNITANLRFIGIMAIA